MRHFLLFAFITLMLLETYGFTFMDETDKKALLEFKSQVSQDKRVVLSSWNNLVPLCNWTGVICGRKHKRVTGLDLEGFQLGGVISPSIGNLSFLISLNLINNSFGGTIPQEVGSLFRLEELYMAFNFFKGGIPASLFNCSRLLVLDLYSNPLGKDVPSELGSLTKLVILDLGQTKLKGKLPPTMGNLTSMEEVSFEENYMTGEIPNDLSRMSHIRVLDLSMNKFSGVFPPGPYNWSSLEYLTIFNNHISGSLRSDFGNLLPKIKTLYMGGNLLTGAIPKTLANISTLQILGMEGNSLTGSIPESFGKVRDLQILSLHSNSLGGSYLGDLNFLGGLANCTQLRTLSLADNSLMGVLPTSGFNMSMNVIMLSFERNLISGGIPHAIGNLINLQSLGLGANMLTGTLPTSLGKLSKLVVLSVYSNILSGEIPSSIGNITRLESLYLYNNHFEGSIPPSLGKCSYLIHVNARNNKLNGTIPWVIMQISPLVYLNVSNNSLTGSLPKDVGQLQHLGTLDVSYNKLSGKLPATLGKCLLLENLYVQGNLFDGTIPDISGLVGLKQADFSNNNLSGSIPGYLANFTLLKHLNLSVNNFEGKVPMEGKFNNATIVSIFGNRNLCGGVVELKLKPCYPQAQVKGTKHSSLLKKVVVGVSVCVSLLFMLLVASVSLCLLRNNNKNKTNEAAPPTLGTFHEQISYGDLRNATNGFSSSNLIGSGGFGTVFKAFFPAEKKVVAVKVLNLQRRGAMKSFMAECESLKDVRHRNLVKLLTTCSSIDFQGNEFRALIYEFMPNGSLDMWLHPEEVEEIRRPSRTLTLLERLNIAIEVAYVLEYLHVHCHESIAHCDLKPSNVLLDDNLTAHVSDFGLARILLKFDQEYFLNQLSSAGVRGTIGYAAPEYGLGGQISIHGDIYSFGILLLELFSGKRPTNELFGENFTLHSYIKTALPQRVLDVTDEMILQDGLRIGFPVSECLTLVLEVGLRCCEVSPVNRLVMSEAVKQLISTRDRFFRSIRRAKH